jgi:hypothetical protein
MSELIFGEQPWYAVRCIFRNAESRPWGPSDLEPGQYAYEERITLWRAESVEEAIARAETDAASYAAAIEGGDTEYVGLAQAYHMFVDPSDGAEVFSLIRYSSLDPDDYLDHFFETGAERQQPYIDE